MSRHVASRIAAALLVFSALPVQAHRCGPASINLKVGECATWEIVADVTESQESDYGLPTPPAGLASVTPSAPGIAGFPFSAFQFGVYRVCGVALGSTAMVAAWAYAPNAASGSCPLAINVVLGSITPSSNEDETDAGEDSDPVNTWSGELFELHAPDLVLNGPIELSYQRYSSSQLPVGRVREGRLGAGWMDNFSMHMSGDANRRDISFRFGKRLRFQRSGSNWNLLSPLNSGFQLRPVGNLFVLMDPSDQRRYAFDDRGRLRTIRDRNDNTLTLGYGAGNQGEVPLSISDGLGRMLSFTLQGPALYSSISDGTRSVSFQYAAAGATASHLVAVVDAAGNTTTYSYANPITTRPGLKTSVLKPEANTPLTTVYDSSFRVDTQTNAAGNLWQFDFAPPNTTMTAPGGATRVHGHDAGGRQTSITNAAGQALSISYSSSGHRNALINYAGGTRGMTTHAPTGYIASLTDEEGQTIAYSYAASTDVEGFTYYDLTQIQFGDGRRYQFSYDSKGNRTSVLAPGNSTWTMTYNTRGQVLSETSPLGGVTQYSYLANGMRASSTDAAGNVTQFGYDGLFRLTTVTRPGGSTRTFGHDAFDQITSVTDERGRTTSYVYDDNQRLLSETNGAGAVRSFSYDTSDRSRTFTDRLGQTSTRNYGSDGRPMSDVRANGETTSYAFDGRGNLTSATDAGGGVWNFGYDALGRVTSRTDPTMHTTGFVYDGLGRVTRIDRPTGGSDTLTYDAMGRLTAQTDAQLRSTTYQYAASGRISRITAGSSQIQIGSNGPDLVTQIVDPSGNAWNYTYDTAGRLLSMTDPLAAATGFSYDNRSRYQTITLPGGLGTESLSYDARNHLTQRSFSSGAAINYGFDNAGRLNSGSGYSAGFDGEGRMVSNNGLLLTRQAASGRVTSIAHAGGPTISYGYNAGGRLTSVSDGLGGSVGITLDAAGRLTGLALQNGVASSFTYDGNDRLVRIQHGAFADLLMQRDGSGFVARATRTQPTLFAPAVGSVAQTANTALGIVGHTHDALGRVTAADGRSYVWDLASRLTARTAAASTASYTWDALHHLISRSEGGSNEAFVWNYALTQPVIASSSLMGTPRWYYVSLPDGRLLYRIDATSNARQFYHCDEVGNVIAMTDAAGTVIASYGYDPYGRRTLQGSVTDNPFTWGGAHFVISDAQPTLYLMGARPYDATRARFLARDRIAPKLHPLAFNPYAYAAGNPLFFIDPYGDDPQPASSGPTGLDIASEITTVVGTAGTVQGILDASANATLDAARKDTVGLGRQFAARVGDVSEQLDQAVRRQVAAQRGVSQVNTRGMRALGNVGNAASFLSGLIEAYKLNSKLGQHEDDWSRSVSNAIRSAKNASDRAFEAYKAGNISAETLRRRLDAIRALLDSQLKNEQTLYNINVFISSADAYFSFGMGLAPGGDKLYLGLKGLLGVNP